MKLISRNEAISLCAALLTLIIALAADLPWWAWLVLPLLVYGASKALLSSRQGPRDDLEAQSVKELGEQLNVIKKLGSQIGDTSNRTLVQRIAKSAATMGNKHGEASSALQLVSLIKDPLQSYVELQSTQSAGESDQARRDAMAGVQQLIGQVDRILENKLSGIDDEGLKTRATLLSQDVKSITQALNEVYGESQGVQP